MNVCLQLQVRQFELEKINHGAVSDHTISSFGRGSVGFVNTYYVSAGNLKSEYIDKQQSICGQTVTVSQKVWTTV